MSDRLTFEELNRKVKELEESERDCRTLVDNIPDLLYRIDLQGRIAYVSRSVYDLTGYTIEEAIGMNVAEEIYLIPEERSIFLAKLQINGSVTNFETRLKRKDGSTWWASTNAHFYKDINGEIKGIEGIARDISELKSTENALKESEQRYRMLHDASIGGLFIHDQGIVLECNQGLSEITGYALDELIGMDALNTLVAPDWRELVARNIKSGFSQPYEAEGVRKDGTIYPLLIQGKNIPYTGRTVRAVEYRDLTEKKQADKEKKDLEGKLRQAQKMEAVGRLAGGVAHDFNNMLTVILGHVGMALADLDSSHPLYSRLEKIKSAGERSADLTRQLLAFARKQTVSPKVLDLNQTVASMTSMLQRLIGEHIDLAWLPGENVWPVNMDPTQIDQILANLCVNARDAIADVGKVTIETGNAEFDEAFCNEHAGFLPGEYILLAVSDDGCGIEPEELDNIFEPFFTTKESGKGTGLGLAMIYGVVKQNNGFINVDSQPDQGTTFRIYLPRHPDEKDCFPDKGPGQPAERGCETILLVEDEPEILEMTSMMLERLGYRVISAGTPGEAIYLAQEYKGKIDLLVTDVIMPEMNGRDLAKNILHCHPNLKHLFMSGYTANVIAHHGVLDKGINFIQKPFSEENLGSKVREAIDENRELG
jgi:two-component system, cell cycle sensor histidine kinase and response regulator CckA